MNGKVYKIFQVFSRLSIPHTSGPLYTARRSGKERKRRLGDRDYSSIASCDAVRGTARGSCQANDVAAKQKSMARHGRFTRLSLSRWRHKASLSCLLTKPCLYHASLAQGLLRGQIQLAEITSAANTHETLFVVQFFAPFIS